MTVLATPKPAIPRFPGCLRAALHLAVMQLSTALLLWRCNCQSSEAVQDRHCGILVGIQQTQMHKCDIAVLALESW